MSETAYYVFLVINWVTFIGYVLSRHRREKLSDDLITMLGVLLASHSCQCGVGPACIPAAGVDKAGIRHTRLPGEECGPVDKS
jgi:hypothetical protein